MVKGKQPFSLKITWSSLNEDRIKQIFVQILKINSLFIKLFEEIETHFYFLN